MAADGSRIVVANRALGHAIGISGADRDSRLAVRWEHLGIARSVTAGGGGQRNAAYPLP